MKLILAILILLNCPIQDSYGQEKVVAEDLEKINARYNELGDISMNMEYKVYANWKSEIPIQIEKGELIKKGRIIYSKIGSVESLNTLDYNVVVDHDLKSIAIMPVITPEAIENNLSAISGNLSQVLKVCKRIEMVEINAQQNKCTLVLPDGSFEYNKLEITYNSKSYLISKLVMYYTEAQNLKGDDDGLKETPRIEISYRNYITNPNYASVALTYERFLSKKGGKYFCKQKYTGYELVDLMN